MIKDRIEKIISEEGITSSKFADEIGTQRSSISHILSGRNKPGLEIIKNILNRYRNINAEWLINGRGNMYKDSGNKPENNTVRLEEETLFTEKPSSTLPFQNIKNEEKLDEFEEIQEKKNRKIDRIVIFYSDNSFEEFYSV